MSVRKTRQSRPPEIDVSTLEHLPTGVLLFDNEKLYFLNKRGRKIFGVNAGQKNIPEDASIFDAIPLSRHSSTKSRNNKILRGEIVNPTNELELVNLKGKKIIIETTSNVVSFNGKRVILCLFTEVSERQFRNSAHIHAGDLLRKIRSSSLDVLFHFSLIPNIALELISDSAMTVLGYTPEELYKDPDLIKQHIAPGDRNKFPVNAREFSTWKKLKGKGRNIITFHHPQGLEKCLEVSVSPVYNEKKKLVGIVGSIRDVTDRIETERLLLEAKQRFDLITQNSNDIVIFQTYLPKEEYLYISPNVKRILGIDAEALMKDHRYFEKHVEDKAHYVKSEHALKKFQKNNSVRSYFSQYKMKISHRSYAWVEHNLVPVVNNKGKISFFIRIIRDITEQKEAELELENQYNNYRNLMDKSPVAHLIHDSGVCIYMNDALLKMFRLKNKYNVLGKFVVDFFKPQERQEILRRMKSINKTSSRRSEVFSTQLLDSTDQPIDVEITSVKIRFNDRDCILSLLTNVSEQRQREAERIRTLTAELTNRELKKEIEERQVVERSLIERTGHLSAILESSTHLIWTVNRDLKLTLFNRNYSDVMKNKWDLDVKLGDKVDELLGEDAKQYRDFWYKKYEKAFHGQKIEFEREDMFMGEPVVRQVYINPIFDKKGAVRELSCIATDITESKIYQQKLINQSGRLTAILDSSHHYIWTIDRNERLTSFNKNYYELVSNLYDTKPFTGITVDRGNLANDEYYVTTLKLNYHKAFKGEAAHFEIETKDKDHKQLFLEVFLNPIYENGEVVEVSGIAHNTTDRIHAQQRIELSLKEKEVLLREVHHRVKNNMQVISSILNLQSSYVTDEHTLTLLKESQNRINTMAYIHESLYQNKQFSSVNFSEYIMTLVNNIVQSYSYTADKVQLELSIENVDLSLDVSIPGGLIINELITNAMKHAFPGNRKGLIGVSLRSEGNFVFLEVKDNGVGFAPGIDFENNHSLGLQLVNTLAEQIDGELNFNSGENGTAITLKFKK